jgi:dTDP-4-dehydrorhamnose reductase
MRILILGGSGMLGHKLWQTFRGKFDTWVTLRSSYQTYAYLGLFDASRTLGNIDAYNLASVETAINSCKPDVVVNAVGIVKQLPIAKDPISCLTVNSLFPHQVHNICNSLNIRFIHISTDCVFSGKKGNYTESDYTDPEDLYGMSKLVGEVTTGTALTLRTSIIGREIAKMSHMGLIEWFLSNHNETVNGYTKAIYTGFPTIALAEVVANVIENHQDLSGLYHVSADPINKYELLSLVRDAMDLPIQINPFEGVALDASLNSERFRSATGYSPPSWPALVQSMTEDTTPYDEWRKLNVSG